MKERFIDWAQKALRGQPVDSDFLTPAEYQEYLSLRKELFDAMPAVFADDWERKLIHFGAGTPDIQFLRIRPRMKNAKLRHRDLLGAILGTGLERRVIGDVFLIDGVGYAIVKKKCCGLSAGYFVIGRSDGCRYRGSGASPNGGTSEACQRNTDSELSPPGPRRLHGFSSRTRQGPRGHPPRVGHAGRRAGNPLACNR